MTVNPNVINPADRRPDRLCPRDRFFLRAEIKPGACWQWIGKRAGNGYGQLFYDGKHRYAHRLMWFWMTGKWPKVVMHTCDNPACVNPLHLRAGNQFDNMQDCVQKGRQVSGFTGWPDKTDWKPPGRVHAKRDEKGRFL